MMASRPFLSVPLLAGQLKGNGYNAVCLDLNVEFFNYILSAHYISEIKNKLENLLLNSSKISFEKQKEIEKILGARTDFVLKYIDSAVKVYKSEDFYNPQLLFNSMKVIAAAFEVISASIFPEKISFFASRESFSSLNMEQINSYSEDYEKNIFYQFFMENIDKYIKDEFDLIAISVPFVQCIMPTFTLSKILKKKFRAKICIGGNSITRCAEEYKQKKEIYKEYCDYILVGDGEKSIVSLLKYMDGKCNLSDIPGVISLDKNNEILFVPPKYVKTFEGISPPSFEGLDFSKYIAPEIVVPILASKGCYWGKCTFCDFAYGAKYFGEMPVEKLVSEIRCLQEQYGVNKFEFVDEAVHPDYLRKFANEIEKTNLKIEYSALARTENDFTYELLEKLAKSGCKQLNWGYESHSDRIIKLMNKGVLNIDRKKILQNSAKVGIWNHVFFLFDFPTETDQEWETTKKFIIDNLDIIDSFGTNSFRIDKHSLIRKNLSQFGICDEYEEGEFSPYLVNKDAKLLKYRQDRIDGIWNDFYKRQGYKLWNIVPDMYLALYLSKFGREKTKTITLIPPKKIV